MKTALAQSPLSLFERFLEEDLVIIRAARGITEAMQSFPQLSTDAPPPTALLYGGFVRDTLLSQRPSDADMQVYGVPPEIVEAKLHEIFPGKVRRAGRQYEVLKIKLRYDTTLDVSVPREHLSGHSAHASGDPLISPERAALHRDFTLNSLSGDPVSGRVFDFAGGLTDLESRQLRPVHEQSFRMRPVHVFRTFQLAARLDCTLTAGCESLLSRMVSEGMTLTIPPNAITEELKKLLIKAKIPSVGIELMRRAGIFTHHFQSLRDRGEEVTGNGWNEWLTTIDRGARRIRQSRLTLDDTVTVMLALFFRRAIPSFTQSDELIDSLLTSFEEVSVPDHIIGSVVQCLLNMERVSELPESSASSVFRVRASKRVMVIPMRGVAAKDVPTAAPSAPKTNSGEPQSKQVNGHALPLSIIKDIAPASWETLLALYESVTGNSTAQYARSFQTALTSGPKYLARSPLSILSKPELSRLLSTSNLEILNKVSQELKRARYRLFTRERALRYVEENKEQWLLATSQDEISSGVFSSGSTDS